MTIAVEKERLIDAYNAGKRITEGIDSAYRTISGFQNEINSCFNTIKVYSNRLNISMYTLKVVLTRSKNLAEFNHALGIIGIRISNSKLIEETYSECKPLAKRIDDLRIAMCEIDKELDLKYNSLHDISKGIGMTAIDFKIACSVSGNSYKFLQYYIMR